MTAARAALIALVGLAGLAGLAGPSGCALASKAEPRELHYFSAEQPAAPPPADPPRAPPRAPDEASPVPLRLGQVTASDHLRYRIVHRDSAVSVDPYETMRWAEPPREYVRRALVRSLFDGGALVQAVGGAAPALDVEVTAFEEVVRPGGRAGRVQLDYQLRDDRLVLARGVVTVERPAQRPDMERVVAAIGAAMDAASAELAERVIVRLRAPAAIPPPAAP